MEPSIKKRCVEFLPYLFNFTQKSRKSVLNSLNVQFCPFGVSIPIAQNNTLMLIPFQFILCLMLSFYFVS
jgi:hypothetical protein